MAHLIEQPYIRALSNIVLPVARARAYVFDAQTTNPRATYLTFADASAGTNAQTHPVEANSVGVFPPMYVDDSQGPYKLDIRTFIGGTSLPGYPVDNIQVEPSVLYGRTTPEISAGVSPTNTDYPEGDWYRYGDVGDNVHDDTSAGNTALKFTSNRIHRGRHKITSTLITIDQNTILGDNRNGSIIQSAGFSGPLMRVGDGAAERPNAGEIGRLCLQGATGNTACLYMSSLCHLWHLHNLLFQPSPCPALIIDNCWDSNYQDIDVLGCCGNGSDPSHDASVIFMTGCNNLYLRGLRIEQSTGGAIYCAGAAIWITGGKVDHGFISGQLAAAVTVPAGGYLGLDDFAITGVGNQYMIDVAGSLTLGRVLFDGGSGKNAAINDQRTYFHVDATSVAGASAASHGPTIGALDLGNSVFTRFNTAAADDTPAAVYSKIYPIRQRTNLTTTANGAGSATTRFIATNATAAGNDLYRGCYLVHNPTGTQAGGQAGARRKILFSFTNGDMILAGPQTVTVDADWSIEFTPNHSTPIRAGGVKLDRGQQLFTVVASDVTLTSGLTYTASNSGTTKAGTTTFSVTSSSLAVSQDITGLYLIDNQTGEPYYIQYGIDGSGVMGVIYDRTASIATTHTFSVVAGYAAETQIQGDSVVWTFAGAIRTAKILDLNDQGFSPSEVPLWGFGAPPSFPVTYNGGATSPTGTIVYGVVGDVVTLNIPAFTDTSNSTSFSLDGLPALLRPITLTCTSPTSGGSDNGSRTADIQVRVSPGSTNIVLLKGGSSTGWTGSGTKSLTAMTVSYLRS